MVDIEIAETEMSNEEYHAHKALGSSNLKQLLKSPYKFFNGIKINQTKAMAIGSLVHAMVLEPNEVAKLFAVMPEYNLRTNDGRFAKVEFEKENFGKTVIEKKDYELAINCANAIRNIAHPFLKDGVAERAFFGELDGVDVKCKPDFYSESMGLVVDLKVVEDASPDGFAKQSAQYGYYLQQALYNHVLRCNGKQVEKFLFVAVEKEAPHLIGIYELDYVAEEFGMNEAKRAIEIYKRKDDFLQPVYRDTKDLTIIQTLTLPAYVFYARNSSY